MADRTGFGKDTTAAEVSEGIDCAGMRAVVTGASGGLGAETARVLALRGAAVTLTARDVPKAEAVAEEIRAATANANVDVMALDLAVPDSVRAFAKQYLQTHDAITHLINNAGVMACPLARTAEGYEMQFATNHLGHFLLTGLLEPALRKGAPGRIVNLSSRGHVFSPIVFDDIQFDSREYDKWSAYGQSKTANVLFSVELDRRLAAEGIRAFAVHPGAIMTELSRHMTQDDLADSAQGQSVSLRVGRKTRHVAPVGRRFSHGPGLGHGVQLL